MGAWQQTLRYAPMCPWRQLGVSPGPSREEPPPRQLMPRSLSAVARQCTSGLP